MTNNKKRKKRKNTEIMVVVYTFLLMFVAMTGYLVHYNGTVKENVVNNTYNKRIEVMEKETLRGKILASDKTVLARTVVEADGTEVRDYPYGNIFSHIIGYNIKGKYGVEKLANFYLISSNDNPIEQVKNNLAGAKNYGDNVITTLDVNLQRAAYSALGNNKGAIVCIEPSTGRIKALVSRPDFDPNTIELTWDVITTQSEFDSVLFNRATQGLYAPGSTFKVFTLLEYMRQNPDNYNNFHFDCTGSVTHNGVKLNCIYGKAHGSQSLIKSFANSCNSAFATLGLNINANVFHKHCEELLFNQELPIDLEYNKSSFSLDETSNTEEIMHTAMGQGETLMTPLHNCMMAAAIANNGVLMKPYILERVENNSGNVIKKFSAEEYKTLMTKKEAAALTEYMTAVVNEGTASVLKGLAYTSAGKTGSAQYDSSNLHHTWYMGFAPVENPQIAICVLMEGGYKGYTNATEVAKLVLDEYFGIGAW